MTDIFPIHNRLDVFTHLILISYDQRIEFLRAVAIEKKFLSQATGGPPCRNWKLCSWRHPLPKSSGCFRPRSRKWLIRKRRRRSIKYVVRLIGMLLPVSCPSDWVLRLREPSMSHLHFSGDRYPEDDGALRAEFQGRPTHDERRSGRAGSRRRIGRRKNLFWTFVILSCRPKILATAKKSMRSKTKTLPRIHSDVFYIVRSWLTAPPAPVCVGF